MCVCLGTTLEIIRHPISLINTISKNCSTKFSFGYTVCVQPQLQHRIPKPLSLKCFWVEAKAARCKQDRILAFVGFGRSMEAPLTVCL